MPGSLGRHLLDLLIESFRIDLTIVLLACSLAADLIGVATRRAWDAFWPRAASAAVLATVVSAPLLAILDWLWVRGSGQPHPYPLSEWVAVSAAVLLLGAWRLRLGRRGSRPTLVYVAVTSCLIALLLLLRGSSW